MTLGDVEESEVAGDSTTEKIPVKHTLEYKFCVNTSCHGLRNVIEAKRIWVRCFWATAVVVAFGVFLQQTIVLVMQYTEFEAVSEVRINTPSHIRFPAVTICNYNRFPKDKLQAMAAKYSVSEKALWLYLFASISSKIHPHTDADQLLIWEVHANISRALAPSEVDVRRLINDVSYDLKDLIPLPLCNWAGHQASVCTTSMFRPVISSLGKCWSFNLGPEKAVQFLQIYSGTGAGLNLVVDIDQPSYSERLPFGHTQAGAQVIIHNALGYPAFNLDVIAIPPGSYGYIALGAFQDINIGPPYGKCGTQQLKHFPYYDREACKIDKFMSSVEKECGCIPVFLNVTSSACTAVQMITCVGPVLDSFIVNSYHSPDCTISCNRFRYDGRFSFSNSPSDYTAGQRSHWQNKIPGRNITPQYLRKNVIELEVFYPHLRLTIIEQKAGKTLESLLAAIGGQMGLFIGASLITLSEFVEYLIVKCVLFWRSCRANRQPTRDNNVEKQNKLDLKPNDALNA